MTSSEPQALSWPQAARAVADAVDVLMQMPAADLPDAQLAEALEHAAVQASRLHAVAVRVTAEADTRRTWRTQGAASLRGWVRRCVQLADDATRLVTAARMLAFMPRMATLFSAGQVSLVQMGTAARQVRRLPDTPAWQNYGAAGERGQGEPPADIPDGAAPSGGAAARTDAAGCADPADGGQAVAAGLQDPPSADVEAARMANLRAAADDIFAGHAVGADARTLAAIGEHIYAAADPADHLGESLSRHERRHLSISRGFENMGEVSGRLDPEATERAITVLNALSAKAGPADERTAGQRRADAFDKLCRNWLESGSLPSSKDGMTRRDRVIVTMPYSTLLGLPGAPGAVLGNRTPIAAETARRLSCDASIRRIVLTPDLIHRSCACRHTCSASVHSNTATGDGAATPTGVEACDLNNSSNPSSDRSAKGAPNAAHEVSHRHLSRHEGAPGHHNPTHPEGEPGHHNLTQPEGAPGHRDVRHCPSDPAHPGVDRPSEPGNGSVGRCDSTHQVSSQIGPGGIEPGAQPARSRSPGFDRTGTDSIGTDPTGTDRSGTNRTAALANILRAAISALPPPLGARSAVLDAGRSTPTFTQPMRDALHAQYGGRCTFRSCDQPATVIHHIVHWSLGGPTSVANGGPVCEYHHYLVHEGGWRLYKDAQGDVSAVPPPVNWPGVRSHWRNGRPIAGEPPDTKRPGRSRAAEGNGSAT